MPNFNWEGYIDEAGIGDIDGLVLMMTSYFEGLDTIIAETPIETWQTYLKWVALNSKANALSAALDDQDFEFYGKVLTGRKEQREPWRRAVSTVNGLLGEVVGKVYVKEHFPPDQGVREEHQGTRLDVG